MVAGVVESTGRRHQENAFELKVCLHVEAGLEHLRLLVEERDFERAKRQRTILQTQSEHFPWLAVDRSMALLCGPAVHVDVVKTVVCKALDSTLPLHVAEIRHVPRLLHCVHYHGRTVKLVTISEQSSVIVCCINSTQVVNTESARANFRLDIVSHIKVDLHLPIFDGLWLHARRRMHESFHRTRSWRQYQLVL